MKNIFVTGGLGYIGSITVLTLLENGYNVTIFDNLEASNESTLETLKNISHKEVSLVKGDLRNLSDLDKAFSSGTFDAVIHFAGYKNISDSIKQPKEYYENNVVGSFNLLNKMLEHNVTKIIFSSSCAVHGQPKTLPLKETDELAPLSPYARTKLAIEYMIEDYKTLGIDSIRLRYFSAGGAHPSGLLGENPKVLLNVIPRIFGAALGKYKLKIFGNNFNTKDGYQERDYIHVMDLAIAHVAALKYLETLKGSDVFGLSTGKSTSVMEIITAIENVTNMKVPYEIIGPITGDPIQVYGDSTKAKELLNWEAKYNYKQMIDDAWNWYKNNTDKF